MTNNVFVSLVNLMSVSPCGVTANNTLYGAGHEKAASGMSASGKSDLFSP